MTKGWDKAFDAETLLKFCRVLAKARAHVATMLNKQVAALNEVLVSKCHDGKLEFRNSICPTAQETSSRGETRFSDLVMPVSSLRHLPGHISET